jgi:hypothetical protein
MDPMSSEIIKNIIDVSAGDDGTSWTDDIASTE